MSNAQQAHRQDGAVGMRALVQESREHVPLLLPEDPPWQTSGSRGHGGLLAARTRNHFPVIEPPAFRYRAVANDGRNTEVFTSNVEYLAGDELPLRSARWTVERVEQEGFDHDRGVTVTVRTLYCQKPS
jgi:hypothetical protein